MHIIGSLARLFTSRLSHKKAYWIYCRIPPSLRDFDTTINYRGIRLNIFTGEANGKVLYYFNSYEPQQLDFLTSVIKPGMTFFDVGANIGIFTLLAAKQMARVFSFDPSPEIVELMKKNLRINTDVAPRITIVEEAVSDSEGFTDFYPHRTGNIGVGRIFKYGHAENLPIIPLKVRMNTLDFYADRFGKPDIIKMDIEGAEAFALRGGEKLFRRKDAPILMMEFHPDEILRCGSSVNELIEFLKRCGYESKRVTLLDAQNPDWYIFHKQSVDDPILVKF